MTKQDKQDHTHYWVTGNDFSSEKCNCGHIRVSPIEYEMRKKAWENYFELVKTTPSYLDHQEMKKLFKAKDTEKMKVLVEKIKQRTHVVIDEYGDETIELDDPLPKPQFPDPTTWNKYEVA